MRSYLHRWGVPTLLWLAFLVCWALQWDAEVLRGANSELASPKLKWWAHTVENWQSEMLQLACAATIVDPMRMVIRFFRAKQEE